MSDEPHTIVVDGEGHVEERNSRGGLSIQACLFFQTHP